MKEYEVKQEVLQWFEHNMNVVDIINMHTRFMFKRREITSAVDYLKYEAAVKQEVLQWFEHNNIDMNFNNITDEQRKMIIDKWYNFCIDDNGYVDANDGTKTRVTDLDMVIGSGTNSHHTHLHLD